MGNDTTVCENANVLLQGPAGYSYNWQPSNGLSNPSAQSPTAIVSTHIQYVLMATDTAGCVGTDSIQIAVSSVAPFSLGADTIVCAPATVMLQGPAGYAYDWQPTMGLSNPAAQSPTATVNTSIQYILTATDTVGCTGADSIQLAVSAVPPFSLGADTMVCAQGTIVLQGPTGYSYNWQPATGLEQSICPVPHRQHQQQYPIHPHHYRYNRLQEN
ncbi:MAG: hypothetical protein IPN95_17640 [Bacteroidetes bacterium]|nr:hypothetical protein [Bacteroidota bacterium]